MKYWNKIHELDKELDELFDEQRKLSTDSDNYFSNFLQISKVKAQLTALNWTFDDVTYPDKPNNE